MEARHESSPRVINSTHMLLITHPTDIISTAERCCQWGTALREAILPRRPVPDASPIPSPGKRAASSLRLAGTLSAAIDVGVPHNFHPFSFIPGPFCALGKTRTLPRPTPHWR
jgi:hypothetical protein